MRRACFALDVGGTKIAAAIVAEDGELLARSRRPTEAARGGASVLNSMADCLHELAAQAGALDIAGIGIAAAGVIDPLRAEVADATDAMPSWKGQRLAATLSPRFGLPVHATNDVHGALLGELWRNPEMAGTVAMLALGTGVGGAIAHNGALLAGRHFLAGHFGRTLVFDPDAGVLVPLDALISGTGLARLYQQRTGADHNTDGIGVMAQAAGGKAVARAALERWLDHLALQLHNLHWSLDPSRIIIGGGVIDAQAFWWPLLQERIAAMGIAPRIEPATLGSDAALLGAAQLVWTRGGAA